MGSPFTLVGQGSASTAAACEDEGGVSKHQQAGVDSGYGVGGEDGERHFGWLARRDLVTAKGNAFIF